MRRRRRVLRLRRAWGHAGGVRVERHSLTFVSGALSMLCRAHFRAGHRWTTLPGLRGLSCSEFRATLTAAPDNERGVAVDCATDAERDALLAELEAHFGPRRFLNAAAAFDGVKDYIVLRAAGR